MPLIIVDNAKQVHRKQPYPYLLTYLLTYSMEQSPPWRANRFSGSQEIPSILLNPKVHYRIHECPQRVPIVGQLDLVHTTTSHLRKIHLNIILPSKPGSPKWALSLRFPSPNPVCASPLSHTRYVPADLNLLPANRYSLELLRPKTGLRVFLRGPCPNFGLFSEKFLGVWKPEFSRTVYLIIPVRSIATCRLVPEAADYLVRPLN